MCLGHQPGQAPGGRFKLAPGNKGTACSFSSGRLSRLHRALFHWWKLLACELHSGLPSHWFSQLETLTPGAEVDIEGRLARHPQEGQNKEGGHLASFQTCPENRREKLGEVVWTGGARSNFKSK